MIFAFLFGLSVDYEVFILSRMREEYDRTGSTGTAVVVGIGRAEHVWAVVGPLGQRPRTDSADATG